MDWKLGNTLAILAMLVISAQISSCQKVNFVLIGMPLPISKQVFLFQDDFSTDSRRHPGFFGGIFELGKLIHRQYTDTTGTLQKILDLLNNSFSDTATTKKVSQQHF